MWTDVYCYRKKIQNYLHSMPHDNENNFFNYCSAHLSNPIELLCNLVYYAGKQISFKFELEKKFKTKYLPDF